MSFFHLSVSKRTKLILEEYYAIRLYYYAIRLYSPSCRERGFLGNLYPRYCIDAATRDPNVEV
jgi:hypothetical protein